jgi:hypothetical protein
MMDIKSSLPGECGTNTGRFAGATTNPQILGTQQERRDKLVHRDAANAANKYISQDAHLKMVHQTENSKNTKQHAVGCDYIHIEVISGQLSV